jgi:hypothetical protein
MVMLACLQSYHEVSDDDRVLELMRRYFRWQLTIPDEQFLPPYWQHQRGGDNLWSVLWLYNRTGEPFLLELADKVHRCTADWTSGVPDWHNVNMAQAFGGPAFYWPRSGEARHKDAAERNWRTFRERYGQVPGGMFGGDENCRRGFTDPRQAIETCGMVEMMWSCERLLQVTGDAAWADRCEDVAFNALPAALTEDLKALRYLTAPNQPLSDARPKNPGVENGGPMFQMNPHRHRCCQHNVGHGWPYFVEHLWMAAPDDGLAAVMYGPCRVRATVGDGVDVEVVEHTRYPFRDLVEITVDAPRAVRFPLWLRVPGWCDAPALAIDGGTVDVAAGDGRWLRVDREWRAGQTLVALTLPMRVALRRWPANQNSVSVDRGPLTFSLAIDERHVRDGGSDAWPSGSIEPASPWNYGLYRPELAPSPVASDASIEPVTLVPMGAARLRVSSFPVVDDGPEARPWPAPPDAWSWQIAASYCFAHDTLEALRDGKVPGDEPEPRFPRFTWWDHQGTLETVDYTFPAPREVSAVDVFWFDDQPHGGCAVPASWRVVVRDGDAWRPVEPRGPYGTGKGSFQTLAFAPVTTTAIRLEVQLRDGKSAGLYEWRVR